MATVDTLLVRIESDMTGIRRDLQRLERQTGATSTKVQSNFSKMGTAVKAALGVAAVGIIGRFISQNVKLASSVEEMQSKSTVVFGQFVESVRSDLEDFGDAVGRSTHELEGMASSVQDTFVPLGFARGDAADLSVALTKLAVDVASFNNASDAETMQAFQSALVGNHEAVRRFGIVITEAELKAELFRMGITKNAADVDAATKVQARLNLIMNGTSDAQGDAERTAGSFANRSKALSAALEELMVNVMTPLLPVLSSLVGGLTSAVNATNSFLTATGLLSVDLQNQAVVTALLVNKQVALNEALVRGETLSGKNKKANEFRINQLRTEIAQLDQQRIKNKEAADALASKTEKIENSTVKTQEQLKADKQASDLLTNLANENEILTMKLQGRTQAEIALKEAQQSFGGTEEEIAAFAESEKAIEKLISANLAQEQVLDKVTDAQSLATSVLKEMKTEEDVLREKIDAVSAAMRGASQDDIVLYEAALKKLEGQMDALDPQLQSLARAAETAADSVSNALADAFVSGQFSLSSLGDIFKQFIKQIIADAIKAQIVKHILTPIFGGGFFGGGGAVSGTALPAGDTTFTAFAKGGRIPARASGGPVLVGERGPELFIPHSSGVIRNNHDTMNMMGGANQPMINQTINIDAGVSQTVRAEVLSMIPRIKQETVQAMIDGKRRGNSISKVFN